MSYSDIAIGAAIHCDNHVHTYLCGHARGNMEEYVVAAIDRGLRSMTFLEHMEAGIVATHSTWLTDDEFDYYFAEGNRLQQEYGDRLHIRLGVECGYNPDSAAELEEKLSRRDWDEIGISCHFLREEGQDEHLNLLSKRGDNVRRLKELDCERLFSKYLDCLIEAVMVLNGTVLCHLDAALRWVPGHHLFDHHYEQIDRLLERVAARGMALEINTSGFAIRGEPFPSRKILERAVKKGVKFVLGSDAHRPEDVGNKFEKFSGS